MTKLIFLFLFNTSSLLIFAQNNIRKVEELINKTESGWTLIQQWLDSATNKVEVLPNDTFKAKEALYHAQVTTRSQLGAVIYYTGGILIDHGWIRILGSSNKKLNRALPDWNKGKSFVEFGNKPSFVLVADDAVGGFFAINGGILGKEIGKVYYLSPDNLKWESTEMSYPDFLYFCFNGDLKKFYKGLRWDGWEKEISVLDGNKTYSFYPYLWTKEGENINKNTRRPIPIEEQYHFNMAKRKMLGIE